MRWKWLLLAVLISPCWLVGCTSNSTAPEKIDREMFDKRKMPPRPAKSAKPPNSGPAPVRGD
jgi:hypothetical protein